MHRSESALQPRAILIRVSDSLPARILSQSGETLGQLCSPILKDPGQICCYEPLSDQSTFPEGVSHMVCDKSASLDLAELVFVYPATIETPDLLNETTPGQTHVR